MKRQPLVYVSPSATRKKSRAGNPYFQRLKQGLADYCHVCEMNDPPCRAQSLALFRHVFRADVFILSFVENVAFHKFPLLQTLIAVLSLDIICLRRKTIVFFFHNPRPHQGENGLSRFLMRRLFSRASYVFTHSRDTYTIACEKKGPGNVLFFPHPTEDLQVCEPISVDTDVLIWGIIHPYKGVAEFLSAPGVASSELKIDIIGECPDENLASRIRSVAGENVLFDMRRIPAEELGGRIAGCRFVLFPYLPGSISGSAALMDTLRYGGNAVGPDVGAFHDLAEAGICRVYRDYEDLLEILRSSWRVDKKALGDFLHESSWPMFIQAILQFVPALRGE